MQENNIFTVTTTLCWCSLIEVPQYLKIGLVLGRMFDYSTKGGLLCYSVSSTPLTALF